jgi:hypothetical protein
LIKTIHDIPNNEVGRYLSCAIGVMLKAEEIINGRENVDPQYCLDALNKAMAGKVAIEAPPACARVDLMVAALEDEIRAKDGYTSFYGLIFGLQRAVEIIKEFKGVEV